MSRAKNLHFIFAVFANTAHLGKTYVLISAIGPNLRNLSKSPQNVRRKRGQFSQKSLHAKFPRRGLGLLAAEVPERGRDHRADAMGRPRNNRRRLLGRSTPIAGGGRSGARDDAGPNTHTIIVRRVYVHVCRLQMYVIWIAV